MKYKFFFFVSTIAIILSGISYCQDTANGIIWYPTIQLSDSTHDAYQPRIALSGDNTIHVTWHEDSPPGTKLPYARSITSGANFEQTWELLNDSVLFPYNAFRPWILARENYVWIFFAGATASRPPIHMIRSYDSGTTWNQVVDITTEGSGEVTYATMLGDSIAIIYPGDDFARRILRSSNGGSTWSRTNYTIDDNAKIALTTNKLHLVQHKWIPPAVEIQYRRSSNLGATWEIDTIISTIDIYWSDLPAIAGYTSECGTELLTVWRDVKYGWFGCCGASMISRASIDNGSNWLSEYKLTSKPDGTEPQVAIKENVRAISWWTEVVPDDTFHVSVRGSNNSLFNCSPTYDLTPNSYTVTPTLTVSSNAIHVVWHERVGSTFRIFYRRGEFIPSNAEFSLSTSFLEMNTTESGQTSTDTVLVSNTGIDPLVIGTSISNNQNFTVMPESVTVAPLNSYPFVIHFTPKLFGNHEGKIIFYHNGVSSTGGSPDCFDVKGLGLWAKDTITEYRRGKWNMVSTSMKYGVNNKMPDLILYDSSYIEADSMDWGRGYWAKPIDTSFVYTGAPVTSDSIIVKTGWNLIGSLTEPVIMSAGVTTVPDSIIESLFYHFNGSGYVEADTIKPGRSYWVKVKQDGKIILKVIIEQM